MITRNESTLNLYRRALDIRSRLRNGGLEWIETGRPDVLAFQRPNGWTSVTNFGDAPVALPEGELLLSSVLVDDGFLPSVGTAWLQV